MAQFTVDFFQASLVEGQPTVEAMLQRIAAMSKAERIFKISPDAYLWLLQLEVYNRTLEGNLVRGRMDMLPKKGKLGDATKKLHLDDDEGVCDESAFIYHPASRILALQRNRSGVSRRALEIYLAGKFYLADGIAFNPVAKPAALAKLQKMRAKKVVVKLAAPADSERPKLKRLGDSAAGFIDTMNYLAAPRMSMELSVGHTRGHLDNVRSFAQECLSLPQQLGIDVDSLKVVGDIEGEPAFVDLVEDKLVDVGPITPSERRILPYPTRRAALREAWDRQLDELKTYGVKN